MIMNFIILAQKIHSALCTFINFDSFPANYGVHIKKYAPIATRLFNLTDKQLRRTIFRSEERRVGKECL